MLEEKNELIEKLLTNEIKKAAGDEHQRRQKSISALVKE